MGLIAKLVILCFLIQSTGCAYMFHGTSDQITIQSPDKDAMIYLDNLLVGKGSAQATAERGKKYTITAKKDGCADHMVQTGDKFDSVSLLGILIDFGLISIIVVDWLGTSAAFKTYPTVYTVTPICK